MGCKSTRDMRRIHAIERIEAVLTCIKDRDWRQLEFICDYEDAKDAYDHSVHNAVLIQNYGPDLSKWSNHMLGEVMDLPLFRYSSLENYAVSDWRDED